MNRSWLNWGLNDTAGDMEQQKVVGGESRFGFDVSLDGIGWTAPIDGNVLVVEALLQLSPVMNSRLHTSGYSI